jgi:hypothetical protein
MSVTLKYYLLKKIAIPLHGNMGFTLHGCV